MESIIIISLVVPLYMLSKVKMGGFVEISENVSKKKIYIPFSLMPQIALFTMICIMVIFNNFFLISTFKNKKIRKIYIQFVINVAFHQKNEKP